MWLPMFWTSLLPLFKVVTLQLGASSASEILVPVYQFTHRVIPEDGSFDQQCCENPKFHTK
jgi:hypothetical protein